MQEFEVILPYFVYRDVFSRHGRQQTNRAVAVPSDCAPEVLGTNYHHPLGGMQKFCACGQATTHNKPWCSACLLTNSPYAQKVGAGL